MVFIYLFICVDIINQILSIYEYHITSEVNKTIAKGSEPTISPVAIPYPDAERIYKPMLDRYRKIIENIPRLG